MKKIALLPILLCAFCLSVKAQFSCGYDAVMEQEKLSNPEFAQAVLNRVHDMEMLQASGALNQPQSSSRASRYIPVVVHVVLNSAKQGSVTDAMIFNMVSSASAYFRKAIADTSNIRSAFRSTATDTHIEFCMAQRKPDGSPTNGIDRFVTSVAAFNQGGNDDMKRSSAGGVDPWNNQRYLNIWVVDLIGSGAAEGGGTGGYAYTPTSGMAGSNYKDGIVIEYEVGFWGGGGSTLAHEAGHYLGLEHTWGSQGCAGTGTPTFANGRDDGFLDTPYSEGPNSTVNCGGSHLSCGATAPGDMFENLMDYSNCPIMFTPQQSALMNVILSGSGLSSPFLGGVGGYTYRAQLTEASNMACVAPNGPTANFTVTPNSTCAGQTVMYTNTTTGAGSAATYSWSFPGGTPSSSTSDTTVFVTYPTVGNYSASLTVTNSVGSDDTTRTAVVSVLAAASLPALETFESATFPPTGWSIRNPNNDTTWARRTSVNGPSQTGSAAAYMNDYNNQTTFANGLSGVFNKDWLISPAYDFSSVSNPKIKFDYAYQGGQLFTSGGTLYAYDTLEVFYSTNCGTTWTSIWNKGGTSLATTTPTASTSAFNPGTTASRWKTDSVNLSALVGQASVRFAFVSTSVSGNNTYLDNVNVYGDPPTSPPVAAFSADDTTVCVGTTVTFTDHSTNAPNSWNWTFTGGTPASSTVQNPTVTYSAPGTYAVKLRVANANGADSLTKTAYITVAAALTATASATDVVCFGQSTGSVTATPSGGTTPYAYAWSGGGNTATISNKPAANYTVTVTDAFGCSATATATITQPTAALSVSATSTNIGCGVNGSVSASASGGTSPYTYAWTPSGATQTINNIAVAATYTVTVTDANTCTVTASASVVEDNTLTATTTATNASCGNNNGRVFVTPSLAGGTFVWSSSGSTDTITGLAAGSYTVTVTVGSCSATATGTVVQGGNVVLTTSSANASIGQSNGSATVTATGGSGSYTYSWTSGAQTATASSLAAGSYTVTVTDANGCSASATVTVTESSCSITANATATNISCGGNTGTATVTTNATSPTFQWNNNGATATITGLAAGTYTVTVTEGGCSATATATVNQTSGTNGLSVSTSTVSSIDGQPNGAIYVTVMGGTPPYTYAWDNGDSTANISGLTPGDYECTVTDAGGCSRVVKVTVEGQTVGIEDVKDIQSLELYPNPANEQVNLRIEFKEPASFSYSVTDALGRIVYQSPITVDKTYNGTVAVGSWSAGVYVLQIRTATETETLKFIKQ